MMTVAMIGANHVQDLVLAFLKPGNGSRRTLFTSHYLFLWWILTPSEQAMMMQICHTEKENGSSGLPLVMLLFVCTGPS